MVLYRYLLEPLDFIWDLELFEWVSELRLEAIMSWKRACDGGIMDGVVQNDLSRSLGILTVHKTSFT